VLSIFQSITITRPVIVKVRVTEGYRKAAAVELREALARLDIQISHLDFQHKRITELEKKNPRGISGDMQKIEAERQKVLESRRLLTDRLKEISRLEDGQEIIHGRVESLVDIKVGDRWDAVMSVELVVEDNQVVEIRRGGSS